MRKCLLLAFLTALSHPPTTHSETNKATRPSASVAVIREMNLARQHPHLYARYLEELRGYFHGKTLVLPGRTKLRTHEGIGAVDEAIRFLRRARSIAPLILSPGISMAAADHVADQADGSLGHRGSDHSGPGDRMNRHGTWSARYGENISYGISPARDVIIALIIDDGLPARHHRKNIFNPAFNYAGAAVGPHARYDTVCSMEFAAGYVEGAGNSRSRFAGN